MKSAREIREQYQMANTLAVKSQKKNDKQVLPVCPASQNDLVDDRLVSYQQNLGVLEIPVNLIVGVAETSEQSLLYTNEFPRKPLGRTGCTGYWYQYVADAQYCEESEGMDSSDTGIYDHRPHCHLYFQTADERLASFFRYALLIILVQIEPDFVKYYSKQS